MKTTFSWALDKNGQVNSQSNSKVNEHTGNVLKDLCHCNKNRKNFLRFKVLPLTKSPFLWATPYFLNSNSNQRGFHYPVLTKANACITLCITYFFSLLKKAIQNLQLPSPNYEFINHLTGKLLLLSFNRQIEFIKYLSLKVMLFFYPS